jgi:hypothetical protein
MEQGKCYTKGKIGSAVSNDFILLLILFSSPNCLGKRKRKRKDCVLFWLG